MAIAWLDLETTGVTTRDLLLEVAVVITSDDGLEEIGAFEAVVDHGPYVVGGQVVGNFAYESSDETVRAMHAANGLWADIEEHGITPLEALGELVEFLKVHLGDGPYTIGGSGVARFDIPWLRANAPALAARFHFREYDVSILKRMLIDQGCDLDEPPHRAMGDVQYAIDVYRTARAFLSVGLDEVQAAAAARIGGE